MLRNSRFQDGLAWWNGRGEIVRGAGCPYVAIRNGAYVEQDVVMPRAGIYTLHFFYMLGAKAWLDARVDDARIDLYGTEGRWHEGAMTFRVIEFEVMRVRFSAYLGGLFVSQPTLIAGGLPCTRQSIANRIHTRLGPDAAGAGLNPSASATGSEGSYTGALEWILRKFQAVDEAGYPDITQLRRGDVERVEIALHEQMQANVQALAGMATDVRGPVRRR